MKALWEHVLPAALDLACDSEPVAQQLFEPLLLQTVRWFTRANPSLWDASVLLDSLFDGLCHPTNAALRDFSARCLQEYYTWVIKHSEKKLPEGVRVLLKRIYNCALHPSAHIRRGAAQAVNAIYRKLRENEDVVDAFIIEMTVTMMLSLRRAHRDDPGLGTAKVTALSLSHILRILSKFVSYTIIYNHM